jgi:hypothetical protein
MVSLARNMLCENLFSLFASVEHFGTFKIETEMGTLSRSIEKKIKDNSLLANRRFADRVRRSYSLKAKLSEK